ncbi:hypothetical protein [Pseudonocardia sp. HH130630-07]|uniref:hypothetical protein n=1 Tax=Pseudonocardia sp. HH130630-07 TaxID=1690815 RepID=UPI000814DEA0|nr:hypothetical protein [Pseudonocardia sp. HH130630-07]ANY07606.1 hypothetical protein AFB00_16355 [Pseudonocardia sp. HH130630-07]
MRVPVRRRAALAAGTAVLAGLLSGCAWPGSLGSVPGQEDPAPAALPKYYDPAPMLADVTARTRTDRTATLDVAGTLTGTGGPVPVSGDGALRVDPAGAAPAVRLVLLTGPEGTARPVDLVRIGTRTWLRPPGGGWGEPGRTPMPPASAVDATVAANVAGGADPLGAVNRYPDAVLVADARDDDVDGTPAVHYTLVVDLVRAIAGEHDPQRREALAAQQRAGVTRLSTEIWLDADRRPLRTRIRQQLPGAGTLDLLVRYRDWGAPVTIDPPVQG